MSEQYPHILALPGRPRELAVFSRENVWTRATFRMWPRRFLGPHGCATFAGCARLCATRAVKSG
jgi:hypothetical protein